MIELAFIIGLILGLLIGYWLGGRIVLYRMRRDDMKSAHAIHKKRRDKYLGGG